MVTVPGPGDDSGDAGGDASRCPSGVGYANRGDDVGLSLTITNAMSNTVTNGGDSW